MAEETKKIAKTMLIVKSDPTSLRGVEQFLKNRDWQLSSTHELKDAIIFLTRNKPSFVLVTVDHPNPKVRKLPKIITAAFPACVIVYAEKATTNSFKMLVDSGVEYKINPPITGPAIERAVNKFIRDREQVGRQSHDVADPEKQKNSFEFAVQVKGSENKTDAFVSIGNEAAGSALPMGSLAETLLAQLNSDEPETSYKPSGPAYFPDSHGNKQTSNGSVLNLHKPPKAKQELPLEAQIALENGVRKKFTYDTQAINPNEELPIPEAPEDFIIAKAQPPSSETTPSYIDSKPRGQSVILGQEIEEDQQQKKRNIDPIHFRKDGVFNQESIFVKGVNKSLDDSVSRGDGVVKNSLADNSHLACIVVESTRFSGYLVAALGKDKKIDNDFVDLIRTKLMKFLKDSGEPIDNESALNIKVEQVDFEGWALEYAQFLRKSVHKGDEVAMAFFPFAQAQPVVAQSAIETMVSIKTTDVQTETPLEFNMYIYMPGSKKYLLYTPQGGKFLSEQKERLARQGVTQLHIEKTDVQNLSKFKAQNHLNSLIKEYEAKDSNKHPHKKKNSA